MCACVCVCVCVCVCACVCGCVYVQYKYMYESQTPTAITKIVSHSHEANESNKAMLACLLAPTHTHART